MAKRLLPLLALVLIVTAPALAGDGLGAKKVAVDEQLANVQAKIARQQAQEHQLDSQIAGLTTQIHGLELRVGDVSAKLASLQADLALHQRRLAKLNDLFHLQTVRLDTLRREYALTVKRLDARLVAIYTQGQPSTADVVLQARSLEAAVSQLDYLGAVQKQDVAIAQAVSQARRQVRVAREQTRSLRQGVAQETQVIDARTQQQAILRGELLSSRDRLASTRAGKTHALVVTKQQVQSEIDESKALAAASAELEAKIAASANEPPPASSGGSAPAPASSSGFIWPVQGPITSPFGMRWGTLHPGIDIGVPTGTPVHAAAAGTVIWCGWMSGYGNLVMIDHHNGLVTLYGHNESIAVSCNENVAQGQVISYSDCTGFCTGPHVHFEVRLHGVPVDPLGYLP